MDYFVKDNIYVPVRRGVNGLPDYARVYGQNINESKMMKDGYMRMPVDARTENRFFKQDDVFVLPRERAVFLKRGKMGERDVLEWAKREDIEIVANVEQKNLSRTASDCFMQCEQLDARCVVVFDIKTLGHTFNDSMQLIFQFVEKKVNIKVVELDIELFDMDGNLKQEIFIQMGILKKEEERKKNAKAEKKICKKYSDAIRYLRKGLSVREVAEFCHCSESQVRRIKRIVAKEMKGANH